MCRIIISFQCPIIISFHWDRFLLPAGMSDTSAFAAPPPTALSAPAFAPPLNSIDKRARTGPSSASPPCQHDFLGLAAHFSPTLSSVSPVLPAQCAPNARAVVCGSSFETRARPLGIAPRLGGLASLGAAPPAQHTSVLLCSGSPPARRLRPHCCPLGLHAAVSPSRSTRLCLISSFQPCFPSHAPCFLLVHRRQTRQ